VAGNALGRQGRLLQMDGVLIGFVIAVLFAVPQSVRSYRLRDQPEPPNRRVKLPVVLVALAVCVAFVISGIGIVALLIFSICGVFLVAQIGFILAGRNPWWMQSRLDRHESVWGTRPT
jgi:hypothetical protein